jgi:hypothetical protein
MDVNKSIPKTDGSFIQSDMVSGWNDEKWIKEFEYLKQADMHYLVMGTSVTEGEITKAIYPISIPGGEMEYPGIDIVDICLRNAEKAEFKVFLGINLNAAWWKKYARDPEWLYKQMERSNLIADELYKMYHHKYPKAFYGWYWVYEVDNFNFNKKAKFKVLAKALNINLVHLREKNERLPIMLSPYMNAKLGCAKQYAENWAYFFENTELGQGDIFCPQDSVGGGGLTIDQSEEWFKELEKAVAKKHGLLFWANNETFDHNNWCSAPLNRFVKQMEQVKLYVSNFINFTYCHYYSPNNIDSGFHKTYLDYIKNGSLEIIPPSSPEIKSIDLISCNKIKICWSEARDNMGVFGYELWRNNKLIFNTRAQRRYGGVQPELSTNYEDTLIWNFLKCKYIYRVRAFDFAGNFSEFSSPKEINLCPEGNFISRIFKYVFRK